MPVTLTLTTPTATHTIRAGNARAARLIEGVLEAAGYDPAAVTDDEQTAAFMEEIRNFIMARAHNRKRDKAIAALAKDEWQE